MSSTRFPQPHEWRDRLVQELHARPAEPIAPSTAASRLVMVVGEGGAEEARQYLARLCESRGASAPLPGAAWHAVDLGNCRLRWEKHTELVTYTVLRPLDVSQPAFSSDATDALPEDWLKHIPGKLLIGVHTEVRESETPLPDIAFHAFGNGVYSESRAGGGAVWIASDFRLHGGDGFERILIAPQPGIHPGQTGRIVQALFEIDTYRMAALLGFPTALETRTSLAEIESALAETMETFRAAENDPAADRAVLDSLTGLSARAEALSNATAYRFAAAQAYYGLVGERIQTLSEEQMPERPTLGAFLTRRLAPAMRTCDAVVTRHEALLERIARATRLLATRVQVTAEEQNARQLESMNTRARMQLRLQQTVEGLSVVALSYYVLGIMGYVFKGMHEAGARIDPNIAVAVLAIPTVAAVWWFLQRVKERLGTDA